MTEIMTLSEFKKAIEDWGKGWGIETEFVIDEFSVCVYAKRRNKNLSLVATISNTEPYIFDFYKLGTMDLRHTMRKPLLEIVIKFASTMPADRKVKEKKYFLRHKWLEELNYLNYNKDLDKFELFNSSNTRVIQTHFTLKEIEEFKKRLDTDFKDFELIEVEEDA